MNRPCLNKLTKTAFICLVTGVIVYESFVGEHHEHLPHQDFSSQLPFISMSPSASGTSLATLPTNIFNTKTGFN